MKRLLLAFMILAAPLGALGAELAVNWSHTITAADTVGYASGGTTNNFDTVISRSLRIDELPVGTKYLWFKADINRRDTTLLNDSVNIIFQHSFDGSTWTFFDSLRINPTSTNDTSVAEATRLALDSVNAGAYVNMIRVLAVVRYDVRQQDSLIIGNKYKQNQSVWVFPRF